MLPVVNVIKIQNELKSSFFVVLQKWLWYLWLLLPVLLFTIERTDDTGLKCGNLMSFGKKKAESFKSSFTPICFAYVSNQIDNLFLKIKTNVTMH